MANTYTQVHLHFVIGVLFRDRILPDDYSEEIRKYITGIVQNRKHKMLCINNVPDHMHMLVGFHPSDSLSDLMKEVKTSSSHFINKCDWMPFHFQWEEGFGAFSVSHSAISNVCRYIENQQEHHQRISFQDELKQLFLKHGIAFDIRYILKGGK